MKEINGFPIDFEFGSLANVSDLIYYDGPLLSHYINANGDNYIFYWVDNDEDCNRWLVVRVSLPSIQKYIKGRISLLELLCSTLDATIIVIDLNSDIECINALCTSITTLPEDYLPTEESYYKFKPITTPDSYDRLKLFNNSSLEIRLTGHNVRYGEMHYDDFVSANQRIYSLWDRLASKYYTNLCESYKANNLRRSVPQVKKDEFRQIMQMDYSYAMAGSVRIILTPRDKTENFDVSGTDRFIQEFTNIIECGNNVETIREYTDKYGPEVMYEYKELVDMSNTKCLNIGVTHYCKGEDSLRSVVINDTNKMRIIENLSNEVSEVEQIEMVGHFYSINTKNFRYGFSNEDENGEKSDGSFDTIIRHLVPTLTFTKLYKVKVVRNVKQKMTKRDQNYDKIIDILQIIPDHGE